MPPLFLVNNIHIQLAGAHIKAVVTALRLNSVELVVEAVESVGVDEIVYLVRALPLHHVTALLNFLVDLVGGDETSKS